MRYSTVPAINFEAHVARNRELIQALPESLENYRTWNPTTLRYDYLLSDDFRITHR